MNIGKIRKNMSELSESLWVRSMEYVRWKDGLLAASLGDSK